MTSFWLSLTRTSPFWCLMASSFNMISCSRINFSLHNKRNVRHTPLSDILKPDPFNPVFMCIHSCIHVAAYLHLFHVSFFFILKWIGLLLLFNYIYILDCLIQHKLTWSWKLLNSHGYNWRTLYNALAATLMLSCVKEPPIIILHAQACVHVCV